MAPIFSPNYDAFISEVADLMQRAIRLEKNLDDAKRYADILEVLERCRLHRLPRNIPDTFFTPGREG